MDIIDLMIALAVAGWDATSYYVPLAFSRKRRAAIATGSHLEHELVAISSPAFPGETLATLCVTCDTQHGPELWSARCDLDLKELEPKLEKKAYDPGSIMLNVLPSRGITSEEADVRLAYGAALDRLREENVTLSMRNDGLRKTLEDITQRNDALIERLEGIKRKAAELKEKDSYRGWVVERVETEGSDACVYLARGSRTIFVRMPWKRYLNDEQRWVVLRHWIDDICRTAIASYVTDEPSMDPSYRVDWAHQS